LIKHLYILLLLWHKSNPYLYLFVQKIACDVAEKEYREGIIKISEYARQRNAMTNSIAAQEDAKRDYINYFEKLQVILGVKFYKIRR
jgi:outer membrane protein TolC